MRIFCIHRQDASNDDEKEPWVDYVRRSAHEVDAWAAAFEMETWLQKHRRKKWSLAGRLARAEDGRWSGKALIWTPVLEGWRAPGRPRLRWSDSIERFAGGGWVNLAKDKELWAILEQGYVNSESV